MSVEMEDNDPDYIPSSDSDTSSDDSTSTEHSDSLQSESSEGSEDELPTAAQDEASSADVVRERCSVCDALLPVGCDMVSHEATHIVAKYWCEHCGRLFTHRRLVRAHLSVCPKIDDGSLQMAFSTRTENARRNSPYRVRPLRRCALRRRTWLNGQSDDEDDVDLDPVRVRRLSDRFCRDLSHPFKPEGSMGLMTMLANAHQDPTSDRSWFRIDVKNGCEREVLTRRSFRKGAVLAEIFGYNLYDVEVKTMMNYDVCGMIDSWKMEKFFFIINGVGETKELLGIHSAAEDGTIGRIVRMTCEIEEANCYVRKLRSCLPRLILVASKGIALGSEIVCLQEESMMWRNKSDKNK